MARRNRRLRPEKMPSAFYRQMWRVLDGAVLAALDAHPDYLAPGVSARTVRNSIVKRATGALCGYVSAGKPAEVRPGAEPADDRSAPTASGV